VQPRHFTLAWSSPYKLARRKTKRARPAHDSIVLDPGHHTLPRRPLVGNTLVVGHRLKRPPDQSIEVGEKSRDQTSQRDPYNPIQQEVFSPLLQPPKGPTVEPGFTRPVVVGALSSGLFLLVCSSFVVFVVGSRFLGSGVFSFTHLRSLPPCDRWHGRIRLGTGCQQHDDRTGGETNRITVRRPPRSPVSEHRRHRLLRGHNLRRLWNGSGASSGRGSRRGRRRARTATSTA